MKQKLELTWIGKEERPRLEPRILLENPEQSSAAAVKRGAEEIPPNRLRLGQFDGDESPEAAERIT